MATPTTALHHIYAQIKTIVQADAVMTQLFNGDPPNIAVSMGARDKQILYINYRIKLRSPTQPSQLRNGKLYFSVYDYNSESTRCEAIADRIKNLFSERYFADLTGVVNSIRTYSVDSYDVMPTDSEQVHRLDVGMPIRYLDVAEMLEKIGRSVPNG